MTSSNSGISVLDGVQQEAQRLYDQHGAVRASDLVAAASDPLSPAHDAFEWDDAKAAHEHRLRTARVLIRKVFVRVHHQPTPQRMVHVGTIRQVAQSAQGQTQGQREGAYFPMSTVASDADMLQAAKREILLKLQSIRASLAELEAAVARQRSSPHQHQQLRDIQRSQRGVGIVGQLVERVGAQPPSSV